MGLFEKIGVPNGVRTRVSGVKGQRPSPLDDGDTIKSVADCVVTALPDKIKYKVILDF